MNDRHPAGDSFPADTGADYSYAAYDAANYEQSAYGSYGSAAYATATYDGGWSTAAYDVHAGAGVQGAGYHDDDPLYGPVPGGLDLATGTYPAAAPYDGFGGDVHQTGGYGTAPHGADAYGTGAYTAQGYATAQEGYAAEPYGTQGYATGAYDTTGWDGGGADYPSPGLIPHQAGPHEAEQNWSVPVFGTAQWEMNGLDTSAYGDTFGGHAPEAGAWDAGAYEHPQAAYEDPQGAYHGSQAAYDGPAYEATAYGTGSFEAAGWVDVEAYGAPEAPEAADGAAGAAGAEHDATLAGFHEQATATFDAYQDAGTHPGESTDGADDGFYGTYHEPVLTVDSEAEPEPGAAAAGPQGRGRRRSPKPRRSALLTVAAPSVAVLGVAGIAAASVLPAGDEESAQAAPENEEIKVSPANTKLDTQLAGLREAGDDFADRASRTQERIDLKKRQEAERKRKAAEAARREALRPKFALPVEGAGISAYFGQAGINWMSVHSGLDFPVSYGTPVKAATDGTIRTQWNPSYGNVIILTAPDGTETWYCHLSSTRIRSGSVQAGTVIGYSGNSGNSTGPHLHFEVRPGGGSAIDPLSWLRSHGLEPT